MSELTKSQLEIVMHLANGMKVKEIAKHTHRSVSTVDQAIARARKKMDANTTAHLVSITIEKGLLWWDHELGQRDMD